MEEMSLELQDVARAKSFWDDADVDQIFDDAIACLVHLKSVFKMKSATDQDLVQGMKLVLLLSGGVSAPETTSDDSVVKVVIGSAEGSQPPSPPSPPSPLCSDGLTDHVASPAGRENLLAPLSPIQLHYQPHDCSKACLSRLPSMLQSTPPFWGQNPLKVPLLCGFQRLSAMPMMSPLGGGAWDSEMAETAHWEEEEVEGWDVIYRAPCGQSLRTYDDVIRFLLATDSYAVLQIDFFTFNPAVRLDPPRLAGPRRPELDLSRGIEPTPVELCTGEVGIRPADFRYRKERWPHGCFLSRGPSLFDACCDCTDGCLDAMSCPCLSLTTGGNHYTHHRLKDPVPSGLYECGPWCGCDRVRCQNRLAQRGIRIRLQVFQTANRGWGVRCRDDLDRGTFVCTYAGVVLKRDQSPVETPPPKVMRAELPSDDDIEVVTEWLAPTVLESRSNLLESPPTSPPTSPPLYVPVIQRPADASPTPQDRDKVQTAALGSLEPKATSADQSRGQERTGARTTVSGDKAQSGPGQQTFKRKRTDNVYLLDATKEGNVGRFINLSCQPNLFIQNIFTDSHDPGYPVIAFFTSRVVKAGTELTWCEVEGHSVKEG